MMQITILAAVLGFCASANLNNNEYLPPNTALFPTGVALGQASASASTSATASSAAQAYSLNNANQGGSSKFITENDGQGIYRFQYDTGSSSAEEQGDSKGDGTKARGSYSYSLPNGERVTLTYTADENGFVAQGSHIPTPPPIPEAILKALEENAAAEARGIFDDGSYHGEGEEEGQYHGEGEEGSGIGQGNGDAISSARAVASNGGYKY